MKKGRGRHDGIAAEFAKFLSQSAEITRRQPILLEDQTRGSGGFQYSESELADIREHRSASQAPLMVSEIQRPGQPPARPPEPETVEESDMTEEQWIEYLEARQQYEAAFLKFVEQQKQYRAQNTLYQDIFRSRDEADGKELILGIVHLRSDPTVEEAIDRPITILDLLVELNEQTGALSVVPAASARNELDGYRLISAASSGASLSRPQHLRTPTQTI